MSSGSPGVIFQGSFPSSYASRGPFPMNLLGQRCILWMPPKRGPSLWWHPACGMPCLGRNNMPAANPVIPRAANQVHMAPQSHFLAAIGPHLPFLKLGWRKTSFSHYSKPNCGVESRELGAGDILGGKSCGAHMMPTTVSPIFKSPHGPKKVGGTPAPSLPPTAVVLSVSG